MLHKVSAATRAPFSSSDSIYAGCPPAPPPQLFDCLILLFIQPYKLSFFPPNLSVIELINMVKNLRPKSSNEEELIQKGIDWISSKYQALSIIKAIEENDKDKVKSLSIYKGSSSEINNVLINLIRSLHFFNGFNHFGYYLKSISNNSIIRSLKKRSFCISIYYHFYFR